MPGLPASDADQVAVALGDLPLAVAQAAGYMVGTGMPGWRLYRPAGRTGREIFDQARPSTYPRSLAAVTQLAVDRLRKKTRPPPSSPNSARSLHRSGTRGLVPRAADLLPATLAAKAADPVAWRQVLARIGHHALARIDGNGLQMHRLTQVITRSNLPASQAALRRRQAGPSIERT